MAENDNKPNWTGTAYQFHQWAPTTTNSNIRYEYPYTQKTENTLDNDLDGRLRLIEDALKDLQTRELNREDSDDEEIRLESELRDTGVHPSIPGLTYSIYDQLIALLTTCDLASTIMEDIPDSEEFGFFYEDLERLLVSVAGYAYKAKLEMNAFITENIPAIYDREVENYEEDD